MSSPPAPAAPVAGPRDSAGIHRLLAQRRGRRAVRERLRLHEAVPHLRPRAVAGERVAGRAAEGRKGALTWASMLASAPGPCGTTTEDLRVPEISARPARDADGPAMRSS